MSDYTIEVKLDENRSESGIIVIKKNGKSVFNAEALGRGNKGNGITWDQKDGNTPTGTYTATKWEDTSNWPMSSYGPNGAIRLVPSSGNALIASTDHKRSGFLIHGGAPGGKDYWRGEGELRATQGCIRVSNETINKLRKLLLDELNSSSVTVKVYTMEKK